MPDPLHRLLHRACLCLALPAALGAQACGGTDEPLRYEDLVSSGRLAAAVGLDTGREGVCADETRFMVPLETGTDLELPLILGKTPRLTVAACRPSGRTSARLRLTVLGTGGRASEVLLSVNGDAWTERALQLPALAGGAATLRLTVQAPEAGEVLVSDLWLRHRLEEEADRSASRDPGPVQILLISLDTLRADALAGLTGLTGPTGAPDPDAPATPGLAAFAEDAQIFTPHYAAASWTKPSHASLLTGLPVEGHLLGLPVEGHGAMLEEQPLSPGVTTLAERLSEGGLRTAGLVYDCLWLDRKFGFGRGFDEYRSMRWHADQAVRFTASWIARHRRQPFFYFLHLFTPHSDMELLPYEATGVTRGTVADRFGVEGYGCREGHCASSLLLAMDAGRVAPLPREEEVLRFLYARGVETTDRALARLFDDLAELGLLDRMLVVVTSDHGEAFFEHGRPLHQTVHEEILRVPLLIRWPGGEGGGEVLRAPTASIDLAPTILRAAGLEAGDLPGRPLQDLPRAGTRRRELFAGTVHKAVIAGPWKAIVSRTDTPPELYRLDRDPGETRNLAEEHPEILAELRERVFRHVESSRRLTGARGAAEIPELSEEERQRLRALGYVD